MADIVHASDEELRAELQRRADERLQMAQRKHREKYAPIESLLFRYQKEARTIVDLFAPTHERTSCNDSDLANGSFYEDEAPRCVRCGLLTLIQGTDTVTFPIEIDIQFRT